MTTWRPASAEMRRIKAHLETVEEACSDELRRVAGYPPERIGGAMRGTERRGHVTSRLVFGRRVWRLA
jgi:hypothetical protein